MNIKEVIPEQWKDVYPLMKQLRTHVSEEEFISLTQAAKTEHQYKLVGVWENNEVKGLVGFMPMTTLYYGRFIWICDLVTDENERSKGFGKELLSFVEGYAASHGFSKVALSSGLNRQDAHRFYEEKGAYDRASFVFKKDL
ncbi:GNAT family N-acetyltransferase [Jeotgalibacillus proteolyticus]|uniref:GNAT family N-acetyltransferase n=1 Tax=Jeotgalibacillus proteolyticus TaxID=2082395 RepID=A0A2S5GCB4_9BACL|nr:GNAT family N-acetyltransferase [Jeotgalibacillus proteolyticus]PPA70672.1 GNAT family N-acetyltransferase [Jeotgalibacillus proteolyticus]